MNVESMDEQQARQRLMEGGYFVALGVPPGVEFGIDLKSYKVGCIAVFGTVMRFLDLRFSIHRSGTAALGGLLLFAVAILLLLLVSSHHNWGCCECAALTSRHSRQTNGPSEKR